MAARLFDEFGVFLPEGSYESFRADLGLSYSHASWVLIAIAPGAIAGNAFAIAADFSSRRVIAAFGAFGFAASLVMFGVGHHFAVLVVAAFLIGMCTTAMVEASELALIDVSGDDSEDNIARSFAFSSVGDLLGPVLLIVVTSRGYSWRTTFLVGAVLMGLYGVWLASLPLPAPQEHPHLGGWRDGVRDAWRLPAVWYVGVAALLIGPLDETFIAFLIAKLQRVDGLSLAMASADRVVGHRRGSRRVRARAAHARAGADPERRAARRRGRGVCRAAVVSRTDRRDRVRVRARPRRGCRSSSG